MWVKHQPARTPRLAVTELVGLSIDSGNSPRGSFMSTEHLVQELRQRLPRNCWAVCSGMAPNVVTVVSHSRAKRLPHYIWQLDSASLAR